MLKEELQQLHEQGSYVGEVSKPMDKKKVLVKVNFVFVGLFTDKFRNRKHCSQMCWVSLFV